MPWLIGRSQPKLEALSSELGGAPFTVVDVADASTIGPALKDQAPANITGLAYCMGDIVLKPFKRASPADYLNCFSLHVVGAAEALKAVEAPLKKNGGSVVLFSTVAVQQGFGNHAVPPQREPLPLMRDSDKGSNIPQALPITKLAQSGACLRFLHGLGRSARGR